jgi:hypothetical protein
MSKENAPPSVIKRLLNTVNTNKNKPDEQSAEATTTCKINTTMATPLPDKKRLEESWKAVEEIINQQQQQQSTPAWKIQATPATTTSPPLPRSSPGGKSTPGSIKKALAVSFPTSHRVTSSCTEESLAGSMVWMKQLADIYGTTTTTTTSSNSNNNNSSSTVGPNTNNSQCDTCEVVATTTPVTTTTTTTSIEEPAPIVVFVADAPMVATVPSPAPPAPPAPAPVVVVRASTNVTTTTTTPPPSRPPVAQSPSVLKSKQEQQLQLCTYTNSTSDLQLSQKLVAYTLKLCILLLTVWMVIFTMTTHPTLGMPFPSSSKTHSIADVIRNTVPQGLKKIAVLNTKGNSAPYYHQFQQQMWRPWEKKSIFVDAGVVEPSSEHSFVPSSVSTHLKKVWSSSSSAPSSFAYETEQGVKIGFNPVGSSNNNDDSVVTVVEKVEKREIVSSSWGNSRLALSEFHIHFQEVIVAALKKVFNTVGQELELASMGQH